MTNYSTFLTATHLDSLIDRYETLVVEYLYMMDRTMSAGLYMDVFAAYSGCVATLTEYEAARRTAR